MTDTPSGTSHTVDLADAFPSADERDGYIQWGAQFLTCSDEDIVIRSASLALEFQEIVRRRNKHQHRRLSLWQCRLTALAMVTASCRARRLLEQSDINRDRLN